MSESERVQRWRQRQRQAGKEPLPIWLTSAEKLRLEDWPSPGAALPLSWCNTRWLFCVENPRL